MIHPTATIHPKARLDSTVHVGPNAVIDERVELGPHCIVGPHVYLTGVIIAGGHNRFHAGCVIGDAPVDLKYTGELTRLELKRLYHALFRAGQNLRAAVASAWETFTTGGAKTILEFIRSSNRGVCSDVGAGPDSQAADGQPILIPEH